MRRLLSILLLLLPLGLLYHSVIAQMAADWWHDPNYSHGFLIPLVSGYLLWQKREAIGRLPLDPSVLGLLVLLGGIGLLGVGHLGAELFLMRFSLLIVLAGLILFLLGRKHLQAASFPLAYLAFMIPWPFLVFNAIAFPLQLTASYLAIQLLDLATIPALREGNIIHLPTHTMEVVDACSGIRSLISLLALSMAFAWFTQRGWWKRTILVTSAVPITLAANALRVGGTGVLSYFFGAQLAQGFFHTFSGWLLFLVAFALLFAEGLLLNLWGKKAAEDVCQASGASEASEPPPLRRSSAPPLPRPPAPPLFGASARLGTVVLLLSLSFLGLRALSHGEAVPLRKSLAQLPLQIGEWKGIEGELEPEIVDKLGVEDSVMRLYRHPSGQSLWLYVGYHASQRRGDLIHSPKHCYPGSGWQAVEAGRHHLQVTGGNGQGHRSILVNRYLVQKGLDRQLVFYWYQERGRVVASEYWGKLYLMWDAITRSRTDGALVRISAPVDGFPSRTLKAEEEFVRALFPLLREHLPE